MTNDPSDLRPGEPEPEPPEPAGDGGQLDRAGAIFLAVRDLDLPSQDDAIAEQCAGDAPLEQLVRMLLRGDQVPLPAESLAEDIRAAHEVITEGSDLPAGILANDRIGNYRVLQRLGEGGFGVVYLAEQIEPVKRRVALKIIRLGMDTRQVVARFEQERQALAMMDHPGIAKVFDAGCTQSGRPYFVMELVSGIPIVEYCDQNHLSIHDRLGLIAQVCAAVQHAHQKGIIHRDLKPSNVLVGTEDGRPHARIIDFGVAKATASRITEKTIFTEHRALIGTPEYMSPEQAGGDVDVDTRTDVYSIGVLLYELLTGTTPFDSKTLRDAAYAEIQRIIREVDPPKPSTRLSQNTEAIARVAAHRQSQPGRLGTIIRGELDWIVMKAMEKDRERRYESASGLGADIRRFLAGQAVVAAPPSRRYRARKFVRRNKTGVIVAGAVALTLVLGLAGTAYGLREALIARDGESEAKLDAQRKAERAEIAEAAASARADELRQVADFQSGMLAQFNATAAGQRLTQNVKTKLGKALESAGVPEIERKRQLDTFAREWNRVNPTDIARDFIDVTILRPAVAAVDKRFKSQPLVDAQLRQVLASRYFDLGLYDLAQPLQESALATRRRLLGAEHADTIASMTSMGYLLVRQGKVAEAGPFWREAIEIQRRRFGDDHPTTLTAINNLGVVLNAEGKLSETEPYCREVLARSRRERGESNAQTVQLISNLGFVLWVQGKFDEAEACYREALQKRRDLLGDDHPHTLNLVDKMGGVLQDLGRLDEAGVYYREVLNTRRRVLGNEHADTLKSMAEMGGLLQAQEKLTEAEPLIHEAVDGCRRVLGEEHQLTLVSKSVLGSLFLDQGKFSEAASLLSSVEPGIRVAFEGGGYARRLGSLLSALGRAHTAEGYSPERFAWAETNLLEAHGILLPSCGAPHNDTQVCVLGLIALYEAWDRAEPGKGFDIKAAALRHVSCTRGQ